MKKIPRDITGADFVKLLKPLGYKVIRHSGSHIRITTSEQGEHHATIPNHNPLKIGTLAALLKDIADHFSITKEELLEKIS